MSHAEPGEIKIRALLLLIMIHPVKPLRILDDFSPDMVPNLKYRIRLLRSIIGEMGDYIQDLQATLPEGDPRIKETDEFLDRIAKEVNDMTT